MVKKISEKQFAFILGLVYVVSLIPILWIARYNYPCADDFGFSAYSHLAWRDTHSIIEVLKAAARTVQERYFGWQGTFSTIFVMALQPGLFGGQWYCLTPWIIIGAMTVSGLYFLYVVLVRWMKAGRSLMMCVSFIYLIFGLQCMVDKTEGFYWFNGATHYMLPYSVSLILLGLLITLMLQEKKKTGTLLLASLAAVFVGGGNYISALWMAIVLVTLAGFLIWKKRGKENLILLVPFLFFALAFIVNVAAPGNSVRQEEMLNRPGVVRSILLSFYYCADFFTEEWFSWPYLIYTALLAPFAWECASRTGKRFSWSCPLLVLAYSYGLLSSMFTPSLFATGVPGGGRIYNIIFLTFSLLLFFNMVYVFGWLQKKGFSFAGEKEGILQKKNVKLYFGFLLLLAGFVGASYAMAEPDAFTSVAAAKVMMGDEAEAYAAECRQREEFLEETQEENVSVPLLKNHPDLLFVDDMGTESDDWRNRLMARYYGKETVTGIPVEE